MRYTRLQWTAAAAKARRHLADPVSVVHALIDGLD
jgi:hypothetical protein